MKQTKSDQIRSLAAEGTSTAEIARQLGIRYQFAYGVLSKTAGSSLQPRVPAPVKAAKPSLLADHLLSCGFQHAAHWVSGDNGGVVLSEPLPKLPGVYAFAIAGVVQYVGLASMGLAKRIYFYARPGATQRTSLRLNAMLQEHVAASTIVQVYIALPSDGTWNSLPVDFSAGLELGLIRTFDLPWNKRSSG